MKIKSFGDIDEKDRETVGKLSSDLQKKEPDSRDPIEIQREVHKPFEEHIYYCIKEGKKTIDGDIFVVVITKKERLMKNVLRNYFVSRKSCPTPEWDQAVYWYHRKEERIEFLWVIPSKDTCELFTRNALMIAPEEKDLLKFVLDLNDGTLLNKAKTINKEYIAN